jgi:hypothetical protein
VPARLLLLVIAIGFARETFAQPSALPYTVCARSDTWTRPSAKVQSTIWNDIRYQPTAPTSYEWTHDFLLNEPDSASLGYHSANLAGLWTAGSRAQCPHRNGDRAWIEIWVLQHRIRMISIEDGVVTVSADRRDAGFEIVQFAWPSFIGREHARLRVVTGDGAVVQEWVETSPSQFTPVR